MTTTDSTSPEAFLHTLVPEPDVRRAARRVGFLQRSRKLDPVAFIAVVVLSVCGRQGQSIASMRRSLAARTGVRLARSSFWRRFTPSFEALVTWLLKRLVKRANDRRQPLTGVLAGFRDVIAVDATVLKLKDQLASRWRGTRRNSAPAAVKVFTRVRALSGELLHYRITPETRPDTKGFGVGDDVRGALYLFDRGFGCPSLWGRIHRRGGFFLTRLPSSFNPTITRSNRPHRGRARRPAGKRLRDFVPGLQRRCLDVQADFVARVRDGRPGRGRKEKLSLRVVGIRNDASGEHHLYVTNVPAERLSAEDLEHVYRLRWEVETFYKTAKSGLGLDDLTSAKPHVVRTMIKAALVRASIAMQAKRVADRSLPRTRWTNPMQWLQVWQEVLPQLLRPILEPTMPSATHTWSELASLAVDPTERELRLGTGSSLPTP